MLSEGSGQNLFLVRDNVIYTPPLALVGAAGHHPRLDHARSPATSASRCVRKCCRASCSTSADEAFFVGTAAEVTPIRSVDKITVGNGRRGPVTEALQRRSSTSSTAGRPTRHGWLTYVYPGEPLQPAGAGPAVAAAARQ